MNGEVPKCINHPEQDCAENFFLYSRLQGRAETTSQISELRTLGKLPQFNPAPRSAINPADLADQLTGRLTRTDRTIASFKRECKIDKSGQTR